MTEPPPEAVTAAAREVLSAPDYTLEISSQNLEFLREGTQFLDWFDKNCIDPFMASSRHLYQDSPGLYYTVVTVCLLGLGVLLWESSRAAGRAIRRRRLRLDFAAAAPRGEDPEAMDAAAARAAENGDYLTAARTALHASLWRVAGKTLSPAVTGRQFLRSHAQSPAQDALAVLVDLVETRWYGQTPCTAGDWETARAAAAEVKRLTAPCAAEENGLTQQA